ncbi:unnamed protein product [Euphydryas editha]|uniref:Uncharacterized protein n=1 Tax=Euphydryas editha TaxID=104508 RepID=A0AAU9V339_EUPED|nr:unnamed protein product [Euphydryas editha]
MKEGRSNKRFPKNFISEIVTDKNGYPSYRHRKPQTRGFTAEVNMHAHQNFEYCAKVESIKYFCKYVNKGSDQGTFGFQNDNRDESIRRSTQLAAALRLLDKDRNWDQKLEEAVVGESPSRLRHLFAVMCSRRRGYS